MRAPVFGDGLQESPVRANNIMFSPSVHRPARKPLQIFLLWFAATAAFFMGFVSCVTEDDLTADQRVYQLSQQLMCPVCDGQTLDQSQAQLSEDMKAVIRTKIEEGETNTEIRSYFVERYGEIVLASPEAAGFNVIAWIVPGLIFIAGALLVGNAYMNMRRRNRLAGGASPRHRQASRREATNPTDLDEFLERADQEMALALRETSSGTVAKPEAEGEGKG